MKQIFNFLTTSKRYLLLLLVALLYSAGNQMMAQGCNPDTIPPVAACDEFTVVAIGVDDPNDCYGPAGPNNTPPALPANKRGGVTWVKATAFDDGSYDNCTNGVKFTIRRQAPYSNFILGLNSTNGHAPCNDLFPDFPSEFERAIAEQDSIKFYGGEAGTTQTVLLRVYQLTANGTIDIHPVTGLPIYSDCAIQVEVQDKIKPVCTAPPNVTVSCEEFDPSLLNHGVPAGFDNVCLDTIIQTVDYTNFDTLCNRGTINRLFKAQDNSGNSSTCSQRIVVNYVQNYFVHFPNDVISHTYSSTAVYGEPTFFEEDCELLATSFSDEIYTNVPDADLKIVRTWSVINWCTWDPGQPVITVPNPQPNAEENHPANLPGPTVSPSGTPAPWNPTIVKVNPNDPDPTDFSTFWNADANMYRYTQIIKVIDTFFVAVEGTVFADTTSNCSYDSGENLLEGWTVRATGLTTGDVQEDDTDANGAYTFVFNGVDSVLEITLVGAGNFGQDCSTTYTVHGVLGSSVTQDIPVHLEERCNLLSVGMATPRLRRCFSNQYTAEACNLSDTEVPNAVVDIELDDYLEYQSSAIPGTLLGGNTYRFNVGQLLPGECKRFNMDVLVNCNAPLGLTHCTRATISPYDDCSAGSSAWSGADVDVSAVCDGDSVRLKVSNVGTATMAETLGFVVVEDIIMRESGSFQLNPGENLDLAFPANGSTWRLEAQEEPGHPFGGPQAVALEGCGGFNTPGLVNAFPLSDNNPFETTDCQQNTGSYDPNDKQAIPVGVGNEHFLQSNVDIEYMVRFQNTGTDTAFTVKIVDTLSQYLDPTSLRILASSHPMEFSLMEGNIARFLFDDILLPDSSTNQAGSNGFVKFRIAQKPDNAEGVRIENSAAIYFDFNDPVITNTAFHTINNHAIALRVEDLAGAGVHVYPNPAADAAEFRFEHSVRNGRFEMKNQLGQTVRTERFNGVLFQFHRGNLQPGIYFFKFQEENGGVYSGKIILK